MVAILRGQIRRHRPFDWSGVMSVGCQRVRVSTPHKVRPTIQKRPICNSHPS